jgi:hypothetical protein
MPLDRLLYAGPTTYDVAQLQAAFQKALWWYNGAMTSGVMALPPLMSVGELLAHGGVDAAYLRGVFGGTPNPGHAASTVTGNATMYGALPSMAANAPSNTDWGTYNGNGYGALPSLAANTP